MKENSFESTKRELLHSKFVDHITDDIKVNREEVRDEYNERYGSDTEPPGLSAVEKEIREDVFERKKENAIQIWWQMRLRNVNVQIEDKRLREMWRRKYGRGPEEEEAQDPKTYAADASSGEFRFENPESYYNKTFGENNFDEHITVLEQ